VNSKYITLERIGLLLTSDVEPKDVGERMLVYSFNRATLGDLLFNVIDSLRDVIDTLNEGDKDLLYLGYALGQREDNDKRLGSFNNTDDDSGVH